MSPRHSLLTFNSFPTQVLCSARSLIMCERKSLATEKKKKKRTGHRAALLCSNSSMSQWRQGLHQPSSQDRSCVCLRYAGGEMLRSVGPQADVAKGTLRLCRLKNQTQNINAPLASRQNKILAPSDTDTTQSPHQGWQCVRGKWESGGDRARGLSINPRLEACARVSLLERGG